VGCGFLLYCKGRCPRPPPPLLPFRQSPYSKDVVLARPPIFRLRRPSLLRGILMALSALAATLRLAGFPAPDAPHPSNWQILAVLLAAAAMAETFRCMGSKWNFYHAGLLILLYSELMILTLTLFLWLYP